MRDLLQSTIGGTVRIETTLQPDLWPALVDPTQIELVILNLAINARDAMAVGGTPDHRDRQRHARPARRRGPSIRRRATTSWSRSATPAPA